MKAETLDDKYGKFSPTSMGPGKPKKPTKEQVEMVTAGIEAYKASSQPPNKDPLQAEIASFRGESENASGPNMSMEKPEVLAAAREPSPVFRNAVNATAPIVGSSDDIAFTGDMPDYEMDAFKDLYRAVLNEGTTKIPDWRPNWTRGKDKMGNLQTRDVDYDYAPITQFIDDEYGGNLSKTVRRPMDFDEKQVRLAEIGRAIAERRSKFGDASNQRKADREKFLSEKGKSEFEMNDAKKRTNIAGQQLELGRQELASKKFENQLKGRREDEDLDIKREQVRISEKALDLKGPKVSTEDKSQWKEFLQVGKKELEADARELKITNTEYVSYIKDAVTALVDLNPDFSINRLIVEAKNDAKKHFMEALKKKEQKQYGSGKAE